MNCANHPETPAAFYCQFCGKPLCDLCVRKINNFVGCEPCLEARVAAAGAGAFRGAVGGPVTPGTSSLPPYGWQPHPGGTDPWVAFALGWIPGVGAMYNGQFAKGLAHVIIFALLVDLTRVNGLLGIVIAAWVIYQVFDAYHTALARRDGLPLPNPLGLNNVGQWFVARPHGANPNVHPSAGPAAEPGVRGPVAGFSPSGQAPPYPAPPVPPIPTNPYDAPEPWRHRHGTGMPTGAVILIVLGVLFLLGNFGILSGDWLDRGWPIVLIVLGVWLVIRRSQTPPSGGVR